MVSIGNCLGGTVAPFIDTEPMSLCFGCCAGYTNGRIYESENDVCITITGIGSFANYFGVFIV